VVLRNAAGQIVATRVGRTWTPRSHAERAFATPGCGCLSCKNRHCGAVAVPVESSVTGEILAWLCPTCGVSWHKGDLPPGRGQTIVLRHPADHLVEHLLTGVSVVWAALFVGALVVWGVGSTPFAVLLVVGMLVGIAIGVERSTRPE